MVGGIHKENELCGLKVLYSEHLHFVVHEDYEGNVVEETGDLVSKPEIGRIRKPIGNSTTRKQQL